MTRLKEKKEEEVCPFCPQLSRKRFRRRLKLKLKSFRIFDAEIDVNE